MNILIIGTGYVGTTTGLVFSEMGHKVTGLDLDEKKLSLLKNGQLHFYEPGLDNLLKKHIESKNITFTNETSQAIRKNDIIFICVGTPKGQDGAADLSYVKNAAESIGKYMDQYKVIVDKSTVPVGTAELVTGWIKRSQVAEIPFDVVSNPEFLREGSALKDALYPDRIVLGCPNERAKKVMKNLFKDFECPMVETDPKTAELIKYTANSFLALKISYINEIARLCKKLNININDVSIGIGTDKRIGLQFLQAGIGYGGSCFPKDIEALMDTARNFKQDLTILEAAIKVNETQPQFFIEMIKEQLGCLKGKKLAVLGLSFKANTDDTRESPAFRIIEKLLIEETIVHCYDPVAKINNHKVSQFQSLEEALKDCDAAIICTDWKEFYSADWEHYRNLMNSPVIFDGRNFLNGSKMKKLGFSVFGI